jgi:DNA-directed RNA polymerase
MIGQMVNNETAQATSGRLATITVSIKDIVKNFDTFTEGIIRGLYAWNMEFNPRTDIKGDYTCKARGVSSLVMKEIRMQALDQLTTTLTPEEREYIPTREFLKDKLSAHDIFIELLTEQEVAEKRKQIAESDQAKLDIERQRAEIDYKKAQSLSQLSKAKKTNSESISIAQEEEEGSVVSDEQQIEAQRIENESGTEDIRRKNEAHNVKMASDVLLTSAKLEGGKKDAG